MNSATLEPQIQAQPEPQNHTTPHRHEAPLGLTLDQNSRFTDFNVSDSLKNRLTNAGFITPTPVQAKAIPPALDGNDILATASTGTGKTLSFLVPMIQRMDANSVPSTKGKRGPIRSLILLPTRELAMQVLEAYHKLVPSAKHDSVLVCGGLSENTQLDQLDRGPRLVVATPGRLEDFLRRREINIGSVEMLVLDEVDRMLDMGFLPAIRRIVGALPKTRQTMCYSATLDANITEIVRDYVRNPVRVEIGVTSKPSDRVELRVYTVMQDQKLGLLDQMLREEEGTFLVFSRTKHGADRISKKLEKSRPRRRRHPWRPQPVAANRRPQGLPERQAPRPRRNRRSRARHRRPGHRARRQLRPAQRAPTTSFTASAAPAAPARRA